MIESLPVNPILYVEDSPDDVFFMQRALKKIAPEIELRVITDGEEAAQFFDSSKNASNSQTLLSLVILDLNLPGRSGLEVLQQIRTKSQFRTVPVILFSSSKQQEDVDACYLKGCNAYVVKPNDPERLKALISLIYEFWIKENLYSKTPSSVAIVSA